MQVGGVPWQYALAAAFTTTLLYLGLIALTLTFAWIGWSPVVVILQCITVFLMLLLIPIYLNLSRTFYGHLLALLLVHVLSAIGAYALLFRRSGLVSAAGVSHDFRDAIYFSVTTFTTLGYGDLVAPPHMRLVTSAEALLGATSLALAVSFFWLYCSELLLPRDRAVLDGVKFHTPSATRHEMRIRNIRGTVRGLEDAYIDPPVPGTVMYWDEQKKRWEPLAPGASAPPGTSTMRFA
jgi:hypothetical protein